MAGDKQVRIVMTSHGRGEVFIDGHKIEGVRAVRFSAEIECANVVTFEVVARSVEIEAVASIATDVTGIDSDNHQLALVP